MNTTFASISRLVLAALCIVAALPAPAFAKAAAAAATAAPTLDACSWDRPGHDPFMGDVVGAVDRYQDIPADVRERLKVRMAKREYDDVVSIRRDSIAGKTKKVRYGSAIRDMHFGDHKLCHSVSRAAWGKDTQERGLVYCDSRQCILVPTVCRNVSRITRAEVANEHADDEVAEPLLPAVAAVEPDPAMIPLDALPAPVAIGTDPAAESTADNGSFAGYGGGFGSAGGGAFGSFASAAGGGSGITSSDKGGFDHVSAAPPGTDGVTAIAPVPEPETWSLMIGGLALLAAARRHSRARSSTPRDAGRSRSATK